MIPIYPARYPVLGDYEDVTWFDATGWKSPALEHVRHRPDQGASAAVPGLPGGPAKNPSPDGYSRPSDKADRIGEYRQAHAAFTERLRRAQEGGRQRGLG